MKKLTLSYLLILFVLNTIQAQQKIYFDRNGNFVQDTLNFSYKITDDYTVFCKNGQFGVKNPDESVLFEPKFAKIVYLGNGFFGLQPQAGAGFDIYNKSQKINEAGKTYILAAGFGVAVKNSFLNGVLVLGVFGNQEYSVLLDDGTFLQYHSKPQIDVAHIYFPQDFVIYDRTTKQYIETVKLKNPYVIGEFSDGLASISYKNKKGDREFGFINTKGEMVISPSSDYKKAGGFYNGTCEVAYNRYINQKGKIFEVKDFKSANYGVLNNIELSFVLTGGIGSLRAWDRRKNLVDTLRLGVQANMDELYPKCLFVNGFTLVEAEKKMNSTAIFPVYLLDQKGKIVYSFGHTSVNSGKLSERAYFNDDLLLLTSFLDSTTVVIDQNGKVLSTFDKKYKCTVENGLIVCQEHPKKTPTATVTNSNSNTTVSDNEPEVISWAVAIVLKRTQSSLGTYSTDYFCRFIVVEDTGGSTLEEIKAYAIEHYNRTFLDVDKNCVLQESFALKNDLDKCKEVVNAKYKLSDWEVDYIYKN